MLKKILYISLGSVFLFLGMLGVVLPGLPTTPFLLLTAWFYVRSSDKLHKWLINHRVWGPYLKNFQNGMTVKTKIVSISIMWAMISLSVFVFIESYNVQLIVLGLGVVGTIVMSLIKQPKKEVKAKNTKGFVYKKNPVSI